MQQRSVQEIGDEVGELVWVLLGTTVPVGWDFFLTLQGREAAALALDSEPGLEDVVGQQPNGFGLRVVGHEAEDECVCGGLNGDTGEGTVEELKDVLVRVEVERGEKTYVWVVGDLLVEALRAESSEGVDGDLVIRGGIDQVLELVCLGFVVVALLVKIGASWGSISLVPCRTVSVTF